MKGLKKLCIFVLALVTIISLQIPAEAKSNKTTKEDAKAGVVQVNTVFTDDAGIKHILCGGTGILIGNQQETEYVITCNHIVNPTDDYKYAGFEFLGIPNQDDSWSKINLSTEVVVEGDVSVAATLVTSSEEMDMVVLQLSQPIYTKKPLTILTAKGNNIEKLPYKVVDTVYALGYPDGIGYDSAVQYFTNEQIVMTEGSIANLLSVNNIQLIEHDAGVDVNNCGGPLVNENGYVIGMNLLAKDGMYNCAIDSTKIVKVIDGLGLKYDKVYSNPIEGLKVDPKPKPSDNGLPIYLIVIICVAGVALIAGIVVLIIVLVNRKDKAPKEKKKKKEETHSNDALERFVNKEDRESVQSLGSIQERGGETTLLSSKLARANETTVLDADRSMSDQLKLGTLIRLKTGEKISINKSYFTIGKDNLHVDYCIKDNGTISRLHAVIRKTKEGMYLEDNNSTNGTYLNNKKLVVGRAELLRTGDLIKISNEEFEYQA